MKIYLAVGDINPYAVDYPVCTEEVGTKRGAALKNGRAQRTWLMNHLLEQVYQRDSKGECEAKCCFVVCCTAVFSLYVV